MHRPPSAEPIDVLSNPETLSGLSNLLVALDRESDLSPEIRKLHQMAKISVRQLSDAIAAVIKHQSDSAERARHAVAGLRPEDLVNLPDTVRSQLNLSANDQLDFRIYSALLNLNGSATLERLLIEFYRLHKSTIERKPLTRRLHAMVERGIVFRTPSKRGVYHTTLEAALRGVTSSQLSTSSQPSHQQSLS